MKTDGKHQENTRGSGEHGSVPGIESEAKLLYRVTDVSELLSISRSAAYRLCAAGILPVVRLGGGSIRIPAQALQRLIEAQTAGASWQGHPTVRREGNGNG
jgi:excisionase family DNA binding protein